MNGKPALIHNGNEGCLLVHGLTSTTQEMERLGNFLSKNGYTISAPLLRGHGTSPEDLSATRWEDWYRSIEEALFSLSESCSTVHLIGISIGATLCLHLAANHPKRISSIVLLAPAIFYTSPLVRLTPLLKHFKEYTIKDYSRHYPHRPTAYFDIVDDEAYNRRIAYSKVPLSSLAEATRLISRVKAEIPNITLPALAIHSMNDHTIKPKSSSYVIRNLGTEDGKKGFFFLRRSGHVISVDVEKEQVFSKIITFLRKNKKKRPIPR